MHTPRSDAAAATFENKAGLENSTFLIKKKFSPFSIWRPSACPKLGESGHALPKN